MRTQRNILAAALMVAAVACQYGGNWSKAEKDLICGKGETMRVLTIYDKADSLVLRAKCSEISAEELGSNEYKMLADKMVATVTSPEEDGVGIAGPQMGISRRIVAVQRFDKDGEPFEVYPNIRITGHRGEKKVGPEGCLSIPDKRGNVERYHDIDIAYTSIKTLRDTTESINGFRRDLPARMRPPRRNPLHRLSWQSPIATLLLIILTYRYFQIFLTGYYCNIQRI